jgi:hypothetical protein
MAYFFAAKIFTFRRKWDILPEKVVECTAAISEN